MLVLTIAVNLPAEGDIPMCVKESIASHLEAYGDTKVLRIREYPPEQITFEQLMGRTTIYERAEKLPAEH